MFRKTISSVFACVFAAVALCGCAHDSNGLNLAKQGELMQYTSYAMNTWLRPVWDTREVYNETVLFVGEEDEAPLLYFPDKVLSVRNYGLEIEYEQGKDYVVTEDGKIRRLKGSSIPYFTVDEYYRTEPDSVPVAVFGAPNGLTFEENRYIKYGEGDTFTSRQIAVTYTHSRPWTGNVPLGQSERMRSFLNKLTRKEDTSIVFYGDSITVGCNASGTQYGGNCAPYTPSYAKMVTDFLSATYGGEVRCVNTAVGGMNTEWGLQNVQERVIDYAPDLAVIAFGMNDAKLTVAAYRRMIRECIDKIHAALPDCVVVVVATSVPNNETEWYYGNQKEYVKGLKEIVQDPAYSFVALADMTQMHLDLLNSKRFRDMTGNNINHPNDFLIRIYAQVILKTVLGDAFQF